MVYYFSAPCNSKLGQAHVLVILLASILGILGSYGVAWFGIRINTVVQLPHRVLRAQGQPARHARASRCAPA